MFEISLFLLYTNTNWPNWVIFLINIIGFFVILKIIYTILKVVINQFTKRTKTTFDDDLLKILEYPLLIFLSVIFILSSVSIFNLSENITNIINKLGKTILVVIGTWFLYSLIGIIYKHILTPLAKKSKSNLDDQIFPIVRKVLRVVLFILSGIYILDIFGINITPLLAGVGIGGLALAFAAQKVLADVFGGISLLLDEAYFIGDRIKVGELVGTVTDIGLRSTKIRTFDKNIVTVPNSVIASSNIENFNSISKELTIRFTIGLTYNTPIKKVDLAKKLIAKCIKSSKYLVGEPIITFNAFNSSSLDLYISFTIDNYLNKLTAMDEINTKIKSEFDKNKIEFALPSQTIYLSK